MTIRTGTIRWIGAIMAMTSALYGHQTATTDSARPAPFEYDPADVLVPCSVDKGDLRYDSDPSRTTSTQSGGLGLS